VWSVKGEIGETKGRLNHRATEQQRKAEIMVKIETQT
jgi:hypothetical protein